MMKLNPLEKQHIISSARKIQADPYLSPESFCIECKMAAYYLPIHILSHLLKFGEHGSPTGYLGVDFSEIMEEEELQETPNTNQEKRGGLTLLARIQALLNYAMGAEMIAYEAECNGHLFQDVVPIRTMADTQTSTASIRELEIHTEQAFSDLKPDILSLACLKGDADAWTYILPVSAIMENLSDIQKDCLFQPLWRTGVDLSFKLKDVAFVKGDSRGPLSILSGESADPQLTFDQDLMTGITEYAEELKGKVVELYYEHRERHCLKPGEIVFIDNRRAVHGRSPFFPKYDGKDRFLVRCFSVLNYEKSWYARGESRVVASVYS